MTIRCRELIDGVVKISERYFLDITIQCTNDHIGIKFKSGDEIRKISFSKLEIESIRDIKLLLNRTDERAKELVKNRKRKEEYKNDKRNY